MKRILENFRAGVRAAMYRAHKAAGEPFAIFEESPKRAYNRPPYKQMYHEQRLLAIAFEEQAVKQGQRADAAEAEAREQRQRADALEESLIALQRELESPEVQVVRRVHLEEVADESQ
jgi:hypothetical protein